MPKGQHLSDFERGQILAFNDQKLSQTEIALKIGRNQTTISRFLADPENYGRKHRSGRPRTLTPRAERRVLRAAASENQSAKDIKLNQKIPLTIRRVQQIISSSPHLNYEKRKSRPKLKPEHITTRLQWASDKITWGRKWRDIIFSDEKKFNLDGPDGNQYYWHDLRKEPQYYSKRAMGGGSVMVWAGFGFHGKTPLVFLSGRQSSTDYIEVLRTNLLPYAEEIGGEVWIFQQDNASIHTSTQALNWFRDHNIRVLPWPSKSPDLNPIENLWGILVRIVYRNGRQFNNVTELRTAITEAWDLIEASELNKLADSMTNRLVEVLKKNGQFIGY
jgi:transposase